MTKMIKLDLLLGASKERSSHSNVFYEKVTLKNFPGDIFS